MTSFNINSRRSFPTEKRMVALLIVVLGLAAAVGLAAAQEAILAIALVLTAAGTLTIIIWPESAALMGILLLYSNAAAIAVQFHGVPFAIGVSVPLVLLAIPLVVYLVFRRQQLIFTPALPLILLFLGIQVLGAVLSRDISTASATLVRYVAEGILLYMLITNVVRTSATLRRVIWLLVATGGILGALGFFQIVTRTYDSNYGGFAQVSNAAFGTGQETIRGEVEQPRLAGSVGEQNRHAQVMLMLVPLGLFLLWGERSYSMRGIVAALTILTALGVATTFSRGAVLGFAGMLTVMVFLRYVKLYQLVLILLGLALLMAALPQYSVRILKLQGVAALVSEEARLNYVERPDGSLRGRANEAIAALYVFADYPVLGVGPGMFPTYYQEYSKLAGFRAQAGEREAHNLYLGIAADSGALGLISFLAILFVTLRNLMRVRRQALKSNPWLSNIATGFMLAIVTYTITGIGLHFTYVRFFWLILALANAVSYIAVSNRVSIAENRELQ